MNFKIVTAGMGKLWIIFGKIKIVEKVIAVNGHRGWSVKRKFHGLQFFSIEKFSKINSLQDKLIFTFVALKLQNIF